MTGERHSTEPGAVRPVHFVVRRLAHCCHWWVLSHGSLPPPSPGHAFFECCRLPPLPRPVFVDGRRCQRSARAASSREPETDSVDGTARSQGSLSLARERGTAFCCVVPCSDDAELRRS